MVRMTDILKPYPAYKNSGVPWLGDVPEHWEVIPGRAYLQKVYRPNVGLLGEILGGEAQP